VGRYERWYENGRKAEEGYYAQGLKDSLWVEYGDAGQVQSVCIWRQGVRNGYYRGVDLDITQRFAQGNYVHGKREGAWVLQVGGEWQIGEYKNGKRDGRWVVEGRDANGMDTKKVGQYAGDMMEGTWACIALDYTRYPVGCKAQHYFKGSDCGQSPCSDTLRARWEQGASGKPPCVPAYVAKQMKEVWLSEPSEAIKVCDSIRDGSVGSGATGAK
jgi:antitoxin component YwqK of YwqJK toxin-antitoxin module